MTVGRLAGRVALITGAARGQGRAHAVRMASEGADIIAVDIAAPLPDGVPYFPATPAGLAETESLVREAGRRIIVSTTDIRGPDRLGAEVAAAVDHLGRLDIIVANAGICKPEPWDRTARRLRDGAVLNGT